MKLIEEVFKTLPRDAVDWEKIDNGSIKTDLNTHQNMLFEIFKGYFEKFYKCIYGTQYSYEHSDKHSKTKIYQPTMVSPTGIIEHVRYEVIPLSELDNLGENDKPYWMRPWYEYRHLGTNRDKSENLVFEYIFFCSNVIKYKNRFLKKVIKDTLSRHERMPPDSIQKIIIDTEGMSITKEQEDMIKNTIVEKTNNILTFDNITFKTFQEKP
jgi:hypothetical protein